jgi:hypothetical protein
MFSENEITIFPLAASRSQKPFSKREAASGMVNN